MHAVPADDITITIIANEPVQSPTVTIMQNNNPTVSAIDGFSNARWTAVHTAGNAENVGVVLLLWMF